jgi:hypothetical protein
MEKVEANNYNAGLEAGRAGAAKAKSRGGLGAGMLVGMIYMCQAYAFFVGSLFVNYQIQNRITREPY